MYVYAGVSHCLQHGGDVVAGCSHRLIHVIGARRQSCRRSFLVSCERAGEHGHPILPSNLYINLYMRQHACTYLFARSQMVRASCHPVARVRSRRDLTALNRLKLSTDSPERRLANNRKIRNRAFILQLSVAPLNLVGICLLIQYCRAIK